MIDEQFEATLYFSNKLSFCFCYTWVCSKTFGWVLEISVPCQEKNTRLFSSQRGAIRRKKNFPEKKNFSTLNKNILVNIGPNFMQQNSKAWEKLFRIWLWGLFSKKVNRSGFGQSIYMYFFSCDLKVNFEKLFFNLNSFYLIYALFI